MHAAVYTFTSRTRARPRTLHACRAVSHMHAASTGRTSGALGDGNAHRAPRPLWPFTRAVTRASATYPLAFCACRHPRHSPRTPRASALACRHPRPSPRTHSPHGPRRSTSNFNRMKQICYESPCQLDCLARCRTLSLKMNSWLWFWGSCDFIKLRPSSSLSSTSR
jgi:hypothetical protein